MTNIMSANEITVGAAKIGRASKRMAGLSHALLCHGICHALVHGDTRPLTDVIGALAPSWRPTAVGWIVDVAEGFLRKAKKNFVGFVKGAEKLSSEDAEQLLAELLAGPKWTDQRAKKARESKSFDLIASLSTLYKRAEKSEASVSELAILGRAIEQAKAL